MIISFFYFSLLLVSALVYWTIKGQPARNVFMCAVGLAFICYISYSLALVFSLITLATYLSARYLAKEHKSAGVFITVFLLSSLLIVTKLPPVSGTTILKFRIEDYFIPLGVSYLVFRYISYIIDVYSGVTEEGSFLDFLFYGSFFPIYLAGPIERFTNLKPQLEKKLVFSFSCIEDGMSRIVIGLAKKLIISNWIYYYVFNIQNYKYEPCSISNLLILPLISIHIYMDFSGYSDIAIGSAKIFGFKVMENFNNPFLQPNIVKFWQCWHISLSGWLRDYLFTPLAHMLNNKIIGTFIMAPIITFAICGLWHKISLNYLIWGALHGLAIAVYKLKKNRNVSVNKKEVQNRLQFCINCIITFIYVSFTWYWFR